MLENVNIEGRWALGIVAVIVVGALMFAEVVSASQGMAAITAVLAALGLYERRERRSAEGRKDGG